MKYLRVFNNEQEYLSFINSDEVVTPHMCILEKTDSLVIKPEEKPRGNFYIEVCKTHPINGLVKIHHATFEIFEGDTWNDIVGLKCLDETFGLSKISHPNGIEVPYLVCYDKNISKLSFGPENEIDINSKVELEKTYTFVLL